MIIDDTGNIQVENLGLVIHPGFTLNDINNESWKDSFIHKSTNGDWVSYKINPLTISGNEFTANIGFYRNKIATIRMVLISSKDKGWERKGKDWDSWSLEEEMVIRNMHDVLLASYHGAIKRDFKWGMFSSAYDEISGFSSIFIKYN